jgi:hypothetical protein
MLPMRNRLPVEAPPVPLQDLDHLSYLHGPRLGVGCDRLPQPPTPYKPVGQRAEGQPLIAVTRDAER